MPTLLAIAGPGPRLPRPCGGGRRRQQHAEHPARRGRSRRPGRCPALRLPVRRPARCRAGCRQGPPVGGTGAQPARPAAPRRRRRHRRHGADRRYLLRHLPARQLCPVGHALVPQGGGRRRYPPRLALDGRCADAGREAPLGRDCRRHRHPRGQAQGQPLWRRDVFRQPRRAQRPRYPLGAAPCARHPLPEPAPGAGSPQARPRVPGDPGPRPLAPGVCAPGPDARLAGGDCGQRRPLPGYLGLPEPYRYSLGGAFSRPATAGASRPSGGVWPGGLFARSGPGQPRPACPPALAHGGPDARTLAVARYRRRGRPPVHHRFQPAAL